MFYDYSLLALASQPTTDFRAYNVSCHKKKWNGKVFQDKALLNKPNNDRTDQEKKYIYRIIGGLKCFKRYPNVSVMNYGDLPFLLDATGNA